MLLKTTVFILISLMSFSLGNAQNKDIPVLGFPQFEKYLNNKSDTVYVINFWATWCAPCRKELPEFEKIHLKLANEKVKVILVSLDFPAMAETTLKKFISTYKITADILILNEPDANSWIDKVSNTWSGAIPATLIYKNQNKQFFEKELMYNEIIKSISQLTNL